MTAQYWTWAAARSIGTSHIRSGKGCDDFGACLEVSTSSESTLIAVASDGAGSALHAASGSWIATRVFVHSAVNHLRRGHTLCDISRDLVSEWLDDIRDRIAAAAARFGGVPRDFASTLVGCLIGTKASVFVHIGDGACVYRIHGDPSWRVPTWPAQGEYAATTYFVTDEPEPSVQFTTVSEPIYELAVFSDGIERLALEFSSKSAYPPFFESMFGPLRGTAPGRNRVLSKALKDFLDGPTVCDRTDDDKTLILAKRVGDA